MREGNQVRETSGIRKVMEYIKFVMQPLIANDQMMDDSQLDPAVMEIAKQQDSKKIQHLENQTESVYIPLEEKGIVEKAVVSEELAQEEAKRVSIQKEKENSQKQRGEE